MKPLHWDTPHRLPSLDPLSTKDYQSMYSINLLYVHYRFLGMNILSNTQLKHFITYLNEPTQKETLKILGEFLAIL